MDFHEESVNASPGRRASQGLDKFPLAAGLSPSTTRQLNTMRRIEDDRIPEMSQNRKGPHIYDKIVVAKA